MEFEIISLKCCFRVEEERMSEENCTEGSKSKWHNKPSTDWAPPPSKQCKRGEAAARLCLRLQIWLTCTYNKIKKDYFLDM